MTPCNTRVERKNTEKLCNQKCFNTLIFYIDKAKNNVSKNILEIFFLSVLILISTIFFSFYSNNKIKFIKYDNYLSWLNNYILKKYSNKKKY
jgi:hypothetical protein